MERTEETLKARVREAPLTDRLSECRKRIGKMCAEGRAPRMCIPVQHDDDDFFICTTLADAQATVEALQQDRDALKIGLNALRDAYDELESRHNDTTAALDAEREKVAFVEQTAADFQALWRTACDQREVFETQLSQLQALVRAAVERWRAQTNVKEGISFRMAMKALEATLDATTPAMKGGDGE